MSVQAAISALVRGPALRMCRAWKIERTDGRVYLYTNHTRKLRINRDVYRPASVTRASAVEQAADVQKHDAEVSGLFNEEIDQDDVRARRFDEASVTVYTVDWALVDSGVIDTAQFWIDTVEWTDSGWRAQLSGFSRFFDRVFGSVYGSDCDNTVGDKNCRVDLAAFSTDVLSVTSLPEVDGFGQSDRRVFASSSAIGATDGWYDFGAVRWVSGPNKGLAFTVQTYTSDDGRFALQHRTPFSISPNDEFIAVAGCDRQPETCKTKFNNVENGRFFPFIRGTPALLVQVS